MCIMVSTKSPLAADQLPHVARQRGADHGEARRSRDHRSAKPRLQAAREHGLLIAVRATARAGPGPAASRTASDGSKQPARGNQFFTARQHKALTPTQGLFCRAHRPAGFSGHAHPRPRCHVPGAVAQPSEKGAFEIPVRIGAFETKTQLGALLDSIEAGKVIVITRHGSMWKARRNEGRH